MINFPFADQTGTYGVALITTSGALYDLVTDERSLAKQVLDEAKSTADAIKILVEHVGETLRTIMTWTMLGTGEWEFVRYEYALADERCVRVVISPLAKSLN